jgi:hypothetical protein
MERGAKSANPRMRNGQLRGQFGTGPAVVDLTKDPISYGMRPSTAIQVKQLEHITNFNKGLSKNK